MLLSLCQVSSFVFVQTHMIDTCSYSYSLILQKFLKLFFSLKSSSSSGINNELFYHIPLSPAVLFHAKTVTALAQFHRSSFLFLKEKKTVLIQGALLQWPNCRYLPYLVKQRDLQKALQCLHALNLSSCQTEWKRSSWCGSSGLSYFSQE